MNILKLWPVPVLLFCFYALYTLVADSYEILYQKRNEAVPLQFLVCLKLSDLYPNQTEVELKELRGRLYDHFNISEKYPLKGSFDRISLELILNRTESGDYLMLNRKVCLIANDRKELQLIYLFLSQRVVFAIQSDTFDFIRMESDNLFPKIEPKTVLKRGHPYSSCSESNGRFHCLNECFKRRFRLARYFYYSNEIGRILLDYNENDRTIQESERICFGGCKRENCKLVEMTAGDFYKVPKEPKIFEAEPVLSAFDFWLQIVGLIFSFVGLFFEHFASTAIKCTRSRMRQRKVKVGLFYLNVVLLLLSLAYCGYLCVLVALDQQEAAKDLLEREISRNLIQPKSVHLAICVKIQRNDYEDKTMLEIERATDRTLGNALEGIHMSDEGRQFPIDYHVHHKILFFGYKRCFPLSIHPTYQTIPSRPILTVRFKKNVIYQLYVLSEEEDLNSQSFLYLGNYAFQKRIVKRLKSNGGCVNYDEKYGNCTGRQNCVERCIARKFLERYNRTTFGMYPSLVIDRDWFRTSEWNTSQLMEIKNNPIQKITYLNISNECEEEVPNLKECKEIKFEATVTIEQPDDQTMEIDLRFDIVRSSEELPSSLRMALDLLGIQSIFFGFTFLQLLWLVYQFIKPKWRLKNKTNKVIWFFICLVCSIGCSWTTVHMLDMIINGELVPTEHYEMAERVQMPTMVFCLRIDQKMIDSNHQQTGRYLEELTRNITTESIFKNIVYMNESNEWTPFDLRRVERFFLLDMKCFRFHVDQDYERNQFHFSDDTQVLRVNFNNTRQYRFVHFMTQSKETKEFSSISNLNYIEKEKNFRKIERRYWVSHEASLYEHEDHFGFLRRHYPPLQEGDLRDLHRQLLELQDNEPNRRTLNIPIKEEHFGLEVDEDRFEQLYFAQKEKPNKQTNLNYRQMFVTNHLRTNDEFEFDFNFHLLFLRKMMHFTNEVNYATLTLSLLNLLSLYLELGVLDLRPVLAPLYLQLPIYLLRKLIKGLLFSCKWLEKIKPQLFDMIDPRPEDSPDSSTSDHSPPTSTVSASVT